MISWKNRSLSSILLSHSEGSSGVALVPPKLAPVGYQRTHAGFAALILVDQLDVSTEEPLHLVAQPRPSNPTLHAVPPMPFLPLLL